MTTEIKTDMAIKSTINKQVRKRCRNPKNRQFKIKIKQRNNYTLYVLRHI